MSSNYEGPDRRTNTDAHWTFKKEIQLTHVFSTLALAIAAYGYISKMETRITLMEEKLVAQRERDDNQDRRFGEALSHLNSQVDKMDSKLDRLVERK